MIKQAAGAVGCLVLAALTGCDARAPQATTGTMGRAVKLPPLTAYVAGQGAVMPVRLGSSRVLPPIKVGRGSVLVSITPDGRTVVAANLDQGVTLIHTATGKAFKTVPLPGSPDGPAIITADGKTAWVSVNGDTLIPVSTRTGSAGVPIRVHHFMAVMAITPDGKTIYADDGNKAGTVIPVRLSAGKVLAPVRVGRYPQGLAVTPDGTTVYVANTGSGTVTPIRTATNTAGKPIKVGPCADTPTFTPDGKTAYLTTACAGTVTAVNVATGKVIKTIRTGALQAPDLAMAPDGKVVYEVGILAPAGSLTPIRTATNTKLPAIRFGDGLAPGGAAFTPGGRLVYVATQGGTLIPVQTATSKRGRPIRLHQGINNFVIAP